MAANGSRITLGGKAVVCCVHDRQKSQVVTEEQVIALGFASRVVYDRKQHRIHRCACCQNLFVDPSDEPRYCHICRAPRVHSLGGPLAPPIGEVDA